MKLSQKVTTGLISLVSVLLLTAIVAFYSTASLSNLLTFITDIVPNLHHWRPTPKYGEWWSRARGLLFSRFYKRSIIKYSHCHCLAMMYCKSNFAISISPWSMEECQWFFLFLNTSLISFLSFWFRTVLIRCVL